ncbi:hypothetical protein RVR_P11 (plasmid) [Actinacidiphila reveromycinica]|uniref:Uncharacterized protein n=1 Tax=Actinacidiphila reveromycinica TaxID=659352 RepID=A0A7R6QIC3_9ACTN|nr:hypothetical protein [Streptomyces sp. SN-593]BBG20633.1 hypothetical protein RVR_P11 [Streptomyces sp. SN-593]
MKFLTDWMRDPDAFDPAARIRHVSFAGTTYQLHNLMGPGWYMSVYLEGQHIGMVDWEDWAAVEATALRHRQRERDSRLRCDVLDARRAAENGKPLPEHVKENARRYMREIAHDQAWKMISRDPENDD